MPLLHYVELGDSTQQSIIIIHGLFGSHKNWGQISQHLAQHYHVIAVDCRNHGDSFNSINMNYHVMANDVWLLLEHLNIKNSIVIGHSMGGKIAMQLVSDHENAFAQLVVVDIAPIAYPHSYKDLILPILELDISSIKSRTQVDKALKPSIDNDFIRQFLLQSLARVEQQWYWKIDWQNLLDSMESIVAAPTLDQQSGINSLFVFGEQSEYYTPEAINSVNDAFNDVQIEVVANGNHWLHYEQADEFKFILDKYLI